MIELKNIYLPRLELATGCGAGLSIGDTGSSSLTQLLRLLSQVRMRRPESKTRSGLDFPPATYIGCNPMNQRVTGFVSKYQNKYKITLRRWENDYEQITNLYIPPS